MATYTLIPSSLTGGVRITNESNAYTNTSSTSCATVSMSSSYPTAWLGGFNFSIVPDESIVSVTIKFKAQSSYMVNARIYSSSDGSGIALSASQNVPNSTTDTIRTFNLTSDISTIISYLANGSLSIRFNTSSSSASPKIYGAEVIIVTDTTPKPNKIMYGENTIIDLTEDTVTRAKVLSGTTFHLPNGVQSVGTLVASMKTATTSASSYATTMNFTVSNEPSSFIIVCTTRSSDTTSALYSVVYNGSNTYTYYGTSSVGVVRSSTSATTFTYSNKKLTVNSTTATIGGGTYALYYL